MRFLSILALSALALTATAQSYTITGKIDAKHNGKKMYLTEQNVLVDSAEVVEGAFKFERSVNDQSVGRVMLAGNRRMAADLVVTPGMQATVDFTARPIAVTGGLNDKLVEINNAVATAGKL